MNCVLRLSTGEGGAATRRIESVSAGATIKAKTRTMVFHRVVSLISEIYKARQAANYSTTYLPPKGRAAGLMKFFQWVVEKYKLNEFFKAHGLHHIVFERRLEDTIEKTENQDLYTRRLQYTVRGQNLMTFEAKNLDSLPFNVEMTIEDLVVLATR